jgi:hypothetical protein
MLKDVFRNLSEINPDKEIFVVHGEYKDIYVSKKCPSCKGKGEFEHDGVFYKCQKCNGKGKSLKESKYIYIVSRATYGGGWPDFDFKYGSIEMDLFSNIKGFFNNIEDAQKLADKLNSGEVL